MSGVRSATVRAAAVALAALAVLVGAVQSGRPRQASSLRASLAPSYDPNVLARDVLAQLVALDTTEATGSTTKAAEAVAARFLAAGFPPSDVHVVGPGGRKQNLVVRYRGTGARKPLLLLAHLDVVNARREDWRVDPFTLLERHGFLYGRGTTDMKDMAAAFVSNLLTLRQEHHRPERDVVLALTADEEGGNANGVEWLLGNRRELIDASLALTEGGGGQVHEGRYAAYTLQAAEKAYVTFEVRARGAGGHSSVPGTDNAIGRLAAALTRITSLQFPVSLNEVTRAFFQRMATVEGGALGRDMTALVAGAAPDPDAARRLSRLPYYNALLRTTCAITGVEGGSGENGLPQSASALVNCRPLPGTSLAEVEGALKRVVADSAVAVAVVERTEPAPPSPLPGEIVGAVEAVAGEMWPGVPVIPAMGPGATDGRLLRPAGIPTYGVGPFRDIEDNRAHAVDERIGVKQFYEEREFLYRLIKNLTATR